jgi:hypothetical protein
MRRWILIREHFPFLIIAQIRRIAERVLETLVWVALGLQVVGAFYVLFMLVLYDRVVGYVVVGLVEVGVFVEVVEKVGVLVIGRVGGLGCFMFVAFMLHLVLLELLAVTFLLLSRLSLLQFDVIDSLYIFDRFNLR